MSELDDVVPEVVTDAKAAKREADRLRKRANRARERVRKEFKAQTTKAAEEQERMRRLFAATNFWQVQCAALKPEELKALTERSLSLWELHAAMADYLCGTDNTTQEDLLDTIAEVRVEWQHGLAPISFATQVETFWMTEAFQLTCSRNEASATFAKYGMLAGLPDTETTHAFVAKFCPDLKSVR